MRSQFILASALALVASLGIAPTAFAQAPQKIAVIDMQSALLNTKEGKKAAADLKTKFTPKEQEFGKRQQELAAKQEQFRKGENTMAEEAKAKLAREIDTTTRALQRDTDDARQDLDAEQNRILQELGGKMMQVLNKYAADKAYTLVLDVSGQPNPVLFASSGADITNEIVVLFDNSIATAPAGAAPRSSAPATAAPKPSAPASAAPKPAVTKPPVK